MLLNRPFAPKYFAPKVLIKIDWTKNCPNNFIICEKTQNIEKKDSNSKKEIKGIQNPNEAIEASRIDAEEVEFDA